MQFGRYCVLTFFNTFEKSTSSPNVGGAGFTKYSLSFSTSLKYCTSSSHHQAHNDASLSLLFHTPQLLSIILFDFFLQKLYTQAINHDTVRRMESYPCHLIYASALSYPYFPTLQLSVYISFRILQAS